MSPPPTKRTVLKTVRLAPRELLAIQRKAQAVGLPVSTYLRELAFGHRPRARRRFLDNAGIAQVSRLGSNLFQLRRVAEASTGYDEVIEDLEATRGELQELLYAVMDAFDDEEDGPPPRP